MCLHLMVINTYMKLDAQIHIRASQDFKNELAEQVKKNNTTISSIIVSSYKRFKDETPKNIQRISTRD